jgi:hypothetical protein
MSKFNRKLFLRNTSVLTSKQQSVLLNLLFSVKNIREFLFFLLDKMWWDYMPGPTISVLFPTKNRSIDEYRETLEELCGTQFVGWHWKSVDGISIQIKFRSDKSEYATILALKWV